MSQYSFILYPIDQVTGVNYNNTRNVSYDYDSVGNRTSVIDNAVTTNYLTNSLNQYTNVGGVAHGSDANGNLVSGQGIFLYDSYNRLNQAVVGVNTVQFTYDSKNRVVKRTTNGVPLFLIYDGWSLIEERDGSGTVLQRYVNGVNTDEILVKINAAGAVYYHQDGLGSVTQLTDSNGNVVEKYTYDIFGKASIFGGLNLQPIASSLQANRFQFTGREWLSEVGLYDYRNRVYSCELGRFLQTDPIRFSGKDVNLYRYCENSPATRIDPSGESSLLYLAAAGAVAVYGVVSIGLAFHNASKSAQAFGDSYVGSIDSARKTSTDTVNAERHWVDAAKQGAQASKNLGDLQNKMVDLASESFQNMLPSTGNVLIDLVRDETLEEVFDDDNVGFEKKEKCEKEIIVDPVIAGGG